MNTLDTATAKKHVLVLGGTGFLGRHIVARALEQGFRVSVFGRTPSREVGAEQAILEFADRETGRARVVRAPENVDIIINSLAAYGRNGEPESELEWVNCDLPRAVLAYYALRPRSELKLFLNIDTALRPAVSPYAKTKAELRTEISAIAQMGVPVIGLRLDQFYGPGDADTKFVTMLVKKFIAREPSIPLSSGQQKRRFLYIHDAVDIVMDVVAQRLEPKPKIFAAPAVLPYLGDEMLVRDVVEKAQVVCDGRSTVLEFGALPDRGIEIDDRWMKPEYEFIERRKFVGLEEGLSKVFAYECGRVSRDVGPRGDQGK